jgi:site-specific recombinase XerD
MAVKVRHLRPRRLKTGWGWYWVPSAHVAGMGLVSEALGQTDAPYPTPAIQKRAIDLNAMADEIRTGRAHKAEQDAPGTIGFLVKEYRASEKWTALAPRTQRDYAPWLDAFRDDFRDLTYAAITGQVLEAWRDRIWQARGHYAAYHLLGTMRALWRWAERKRHIKPEDNPARQVENERPPKRRHTWTLEQVCAFLDAAWAEGEIGIFVAVVVADCISQSPVDVWGLVRADYDGRALGKARRTKVEGEHPRTPLFPHVIGLLDWYLAQRPALLPDAPLFPPEGQNVPWVASTRHKAFQRIRRAAGLPSHLQMQDLRRTGATEAGAAGVGEIGIRDLLRHQTTSEASTYTLNTDTSLRDVQTKRMAARARNKDEC